MLVYTIFMISLISHKSFILEFNRFAPHVEDVSSVIRSK